MKLALSPELFLSALGGRLIVAVEIMMWSACLKKVDSDEFSDSTKECMLSGVRRILLVWKK